MTRVILDTFTTAHLFEHLQIIHGPLFQALGFDQFVLLFHTGQGFGQLVADALHGLSQGVLGCYVVGSRKDANFRQVLQFTPAQGIHVRDAFNLVTPPFNANSPVAFVGGKISTVSPRTGNVPREKSMSCGRNEFQPAAVTPDPGRSLDPRPRSTRISKIRFDSANAVYTRYRGDNNDIASVQQPIGGRVAHLGQSLR